MTASVERAFTLIRGDDDGTRLTLADDVAVYMQHKRKRLTKASQRGYRAALDAFVAYFPPDTTIDRFEPPIGTRKLESFLAEQWGERSGRTYNKNLSIIRDFFRWCALRGRILGDPTLAIERAKVRQFQRASFTDAQHDAILAANPDAHDWLPLKLLLDYGIRKGALQTVRFEDFDHAARRLVIFTKGETIHRFPIPEEAFWDTLADHIAAIDAQPHHYLLPGQSLKRVRPVCRRELDLLETQLTHEVELAAKIVEQLGSRQARALLDHLEASVEWVQLVRDQATEKITRYPARKMGEHGMHSWWYRCLARAGVVAPGTSSGTRMHQARHTAAQRVLERTGNLKAAQALLGHTSSATTDAYVGWDDSNLEGTMREVLNV